MVSQHEFPVQIMTCYQIIFNYMNNYFVYMFVDI